MLEAEKKKVSGVYEKLPIHNKRRSQRFQINTWSRAFTKTKLVDSLCGWVSTVGLLVGMKFRFQISSPRWIQGFSSSAHKGYCRTYPKNVFLPIVFAVLPQQDKIRQHLGWNWTNYYWLGNCLLPIISFRIFLRTLAASTQSCIFFQKERGASEIVVTNLFIHCLVSKRVNFLPFIYLLSWKLVPFCQWSANQTHNLFN